MSSAEASAVSGEIAIVQVTSEDCGGVEPSLYIPVSNKARAPNTTKRELVRLIELRILPAAQMQWLRAYSPQNRAELDTNLRNEETLGNPNKVYWNELAEIFNSRETDESNCFRPQNIVCDYSDEISIAQQ